MRPSRGKSGLCAGSLGRVATLLVALLATGACAYAQPTITGLRVLSGKNALAVHAHPEVSEFVPVNDCALGDLTVSHFEGVITLDLSRLSTQEHRPCAIVLNISSALALEVVSVEGRVTLDGSLREFRGVNTRGVFRIRNPAATPITLSNWQGALSVEDSHGPVSVQSFGGELVLRRHRGSVSVSTIGALVIARDIELPAGSVSRIAVVNADVVLDRVRARNQRGRTAAIKLRAAVIMGRRQISAEFRNQQRRALKNRAAVPAAILRISAENGWLTVMP